MEFAVVDLFAQFGETPVTTEMIAAALGVAPDHPQLVIAIDALVRVGYLNDANGSGYQRSTDERLVEGQLRCSSKGGKGFCFAIRDEPGVQDVYINGMNLNGAWHGDRVITRLIKDGHRRRSPEGQVAAVIERANPTIVARLKPTESGFKGVPLDDRLLFEADLEFAPGQTAAADKLVYVEIKRYPLGQRPAVGYVHKVLGGETGTDIDVDLIGCKHDLPQQFPPEMTVMAAALKPKLTKPELKRRQDFSKDTVLALMGQGVSELAVSLQSRGEKGWHLGIHIADVAHTLEANHPIDAEAYLRGAAVQLGASVVPLLPAALVEAASLSVGEVRPTISLLINLDPAGAVETYQLQPSIIQPQGSITEADLAAVLAGEPPQVSTETIAMLHNLTKVIPLLRAQRQALGCYDLALPAQDRADEGFGVAVTTPSYRQELGIWANYLIAKHFQALNVPALYRRQDLPSSNDLQTWLAMAANKGLDLKLAQEDTVTPADLERFAAVEDVALAHQLLSLLPPITEALAPGWALGLPVYVHAASPLHRYVDVLHQRLIHAIFDKARDKPRSKTGLDLRSSTCHGQVDWCIFAPKSQQELESVVTNALEYLNAQQQRIARAEAELQGLKRSEAMQRFVGQPTTGTIASVYRYGFFVIIDEILAEGLVHVSSLRNDWYEYRSWQQTLVGKKSQRQFRPGERIEVEVKNVDYYRQQIDLALVGTESDDNGDD